MSDSLSLSAYSFSFFPDLPIESYFPCSTASTSTTLASSPPHLSLDSTPPSSVASRGAGKPAESTGTSGESRKDGDGVEEPGARRAGGGEGGGEREAEDWFSARMAERASKREETLGKQAQVKMGMRRARSKSYEGDEAEVMKEKSSKKARTALYKPSPPLSPWSGASNPAVLPPSSQFKRAALSPNPFSSSVVLTLPPTPDFQRLFTPLVHLQRSLTFSDYAPYLLSSQPVDLSWSFAYGQAIINFLQSLSPPQKWSSRPQARVFEASWFTEDVQRAMETQPDAEYIRRTYPLQRLVPPSSKARGEDGAKWMGIREVFRWIWGELPDVWADVAWAVAELPLALLALCRQWASARQHRLAVSIAWQECATYLLSAVPFSRMTPRERQARILLSWLHGNGRRQELFFCDEKGRVREGEEAWAWWFRDGEAGRTVQELDTREGEQVQLAAGRWKE